MERNAMGQEAKKAIEEGIQEGLKLLVLSNAPKQSDLSRVKIYPVAVKGKMKYQIEEYRKNQVFHSNCEEAEVAGEAIKRLE